MKWNKRLNGVLLLTIFFSCFELSAQDPIPVKTKTDTNHGPVIPCKEMRIVMSFVNVDNPMPDTFRKAADNIIEDSQLSLSSFWEKMSAMDRPIRVVHIGDSHVRGHIFPYVMRKLLEDDFGHDAVIDYQVNYWSPGLATETGKAGIVYHILGVNGATFGSYNTPERIHSITKLNPDLIVVSFGTNEAHRRNYRMGEHVAEMNKLFADLKKACPNAAYLMTTPPGAYIRSGRRKIINKRTPKVVDTEISFARQHGVAIWDLYSVIGGKDYGCKNWTAAKMFQHDKIHFTQAGYTLQGLLFHEAFIKAYNDYVASQLN